ncbi:hypothetical protein TruAng_001539 [Truncatella angustata]|nr:hypothetical protein TruAng_001539 [Truncatella angustata]
MKSLQRTSHQQYYQLFCVKALKEMTVDFILALQYDEVNVNNDPRIFSNYGHIVRKSSMDGAMDMKTYYMLTEEDNSSAESGHSLPLSMDEVKASRAPCNCSARADGSSNTKDTATAAAHKLADRIAKSMRLNLMPYCVGEDRFKTELYLWRYIIIYLDRAREKEQQFKRKIGEDSNVASQRESFALMFTLDLDRRIVVEAKDEELKQEVEHHIGAARELLDFSPGIQVLKTEVNTAETFLRDGVFYEPVPPEESKAVIMSMEKEFLGTGRWYRRVQRPSRHGSPVDSRNHEPADGVAVALDPQEVASGVQDMAL